MSESAIVTIRNEQLLMHPDRAVIWPKAAAVIVADTHFGKSGVFNRNGLAVPGGTDEADLERLTRLIRASSSRRLIVLGDFLHAPLAPESHAARALEDWTRSLAGIHIQVIAGNHDRGTTTGWRGSIDWISGEHLEPPFRFVHDAGDGTAHHEFFYLSGHVHPVASLQGLRKRAARVPVFWLRNSGLVLPSFGSFTGGYIVSAAQGERIFAVSPESVVPFPAR
jgi:uncharacterized protein